MKYRDFQELCKREWEDRRGDVGTLWLTEKSYRELKEDAALQQAGSDLKLKALSDEQLNGFSFRTLVNPFSGTLVKMRLARDTDVADVWYHDRHFETHFLNPEEARARGIQI